MLRRKKAKGKHIIKFLRRHKWIGSIVLLIIVCLFVTTFFILTERLKPLIKSRTDWKANRLPDDLKLFTTPINNIVITHTDDKAELCTFSVNSLTSKTNWFY